MLRSVFVKQRAGMFHKESCWFSNKTCRVDDRAQKSWLAITATTFAELRTTCKKSCTRTNPANMVQQLTKLHNNAAWHRRARFQLQREPLCAMCLAEGKVVAARIADHIEPHHNDPIRFWNGKLQSLCARIATRVGRSSWRTAALTRQSALMAGRSIYGIRSIGILDSGGLRILFGGCAFSIPVVYELLEGDSCPVRPATSPLCRLAVFWHPAYIFDCAKHGAIFDRQRLGG
jgi:hypothetical protein